MRVLHVAGPRGEARVTIEPWWLTAEGVARVAVERWVDGPGLGSRVAGHYRAVRAWIAVEYVPWWAPWRRLRLLRRVLDRAVRLAEKEAEAVVRRRVALALSQGREPEVPRRSPGSQPLPMSHP
jgi:hypothetical protein